MTQVLLALIAGVAAGGIVVFVVVIQLAKVEAARMTKLDKRVRILEAKLGGAGVAVVTFGVPPITAPVPPLDGPELDKALRTEMTPPSKPRHLQPVPDDDPPPTGAA